MSPSPHSLSPLGGWLSAGFSVDSNRPLVGLAVCRADASADAASAEALCRKIEQGVSLAGGLALRLNLLHVSPSSQSPCSSGFGRFPFRDVLSDQLECVAHASGLAGLVIAADENEAAAGLLLGAARLRLPTLFVPLRGSLADTPLPEADDYSHHSVSLLSEVLGISLPLSSSVADGSEDQSRLAEEAGRRAVELTRQNFTVDRLWGANAFFNAARADAAFGGSSGTVRFLSALARAAGVPLSLSSFDEIGLATPQVVRLSGEKSKRLRDFHAAGGVPALAAALRGGWKSSLAVSGKSLTEVAKTAKCKEGELLHLKRPYRRHGGVAIVKGNCAEGGAVLSLPTGGAPLDKTGLPPAVAGPACVFDDAASAVAAVRGGRIKPSDVLVLRYQGAKGGPGLQPQRALARALAEKNAAVPVVTDGWWGAPSSALVVEMVSPEAMDGSPLALLRDGDRVLIDPAQRRLSVQLTEMDLKLRRVRWQAPAPRAAQGYWARYARHVTPAIEGAVVG